SRASGPPWSRRSSRGSAGSSARSAGGRRSEPCGAGYTQRMQRTIVVGDVHGCADELQDVLRACGYARGDRLALVGDLVAKGPDSHAVLELARQERALAVLGNHDAHALHAREEAAADEPIKPERRQLLDSLSPADWSY